MDESTDNSILSDIEISDSLKSKLRRHGVRNDLQLKKFVENSKIQEENVHFSQEEISALVVAYQSLPNNAQSSVATPWQKVKAFCASFYFHLGAFLSLGAAAVTISSYLETHPIQLTEDSTRSPNAVNQSGVLEQSNSLEKSKKIEREEMDKAMLVVKSDEDKKPTVVQSPNPVSTNVKRTEKKSTPKLEQTFDSPPMRKAEDNFEKKNKSLSDSSDSIAKVKPKGAKTPNVKQKIVPTKDDLLDVGKFLISKQGKSGENLYIYPEFLNENSSESNSDISIQNRSLKFFGKLLFVNGSKNIYSIKLPKSIAPGFYKFTLIHNFVPYEMNKAIRIVQ